MVDRALNSTVLERHTFKHQSRLESGWNKCALIIIVEILGMEVLPFKLSSAHHHCGNQMEVLP